MIVVPLKQNSWKRAKEFPDTNSFGQTQKKQPSALKSTVSILQEPSKNSIFCCVVSRGLMWMITPPAAPGKTNRTLSDVFVLRYEFTDLLWNSSFIQLTADFLVLQNSQYTRFFTFREIQALQCYNLVVYENFLYSLILENIRYLLRVSDSW